MKLRYKITNYVMGCYLLAPVADLVANVELLEPLADKSNNE